MLTCLGRGARGAAPLVVLHELRINRCRVSRTVYNQINSCTDRKNQQQTEYVLRIPVRFCAVACMHQIFNGETMQLLLFPKHAYHIPAKSIDRIPSPTQNQCISPGKASESSSPSARNPVLTRLGKKLSQSLVRKLMLLYTIRREVHNRNLRLTCHPVPSGTGQQHVRYRDTYVHSLLPPLRPSSLVLYIKTRLASSYRLMRNLSLKSSTPLT